MDGVEYSIMDRIKSTYDDISNPTCVGIYEPNFSLKYYILDFIKFMKIL